MTDLLESLVDGLDTQSKKRDERVARHSRTYRCRCGNHIFFDNTLCLYERSGDWLYDVGLPGKSGVSGGMVTVAPGKGALAVCSPRLDAAGNSVRGRLVTRFLSERLGLNLFASAPSVQVRASSQVSQ